MIAPTFEQAKQITVDGEVFMCEKHGLDYRIVCKECQEKYEKFSKITSEIIKINRKENI